jgi:hypothetical protein
MFFLAVQSALLSPCRRDNGNGRHRWGRPSRLPLRASTSLRHEICGELSKEPRSGSRASARSGRMKETNVARCERASTIAAADTYRATVERPQNERSDAFCTGPDATGVRTASTGTGRSGASAGLAGRYSGDFGKDRTMSDAGTALSQFVADLPKPRLVWCQVEETPPRVCRTELVRVAPETATAWARRKIAPAEPDRRKALFFAEMMRGGMRHPRPEEPITLKVLDNGETCLTDGQHRLAAVDLVGARPLSCWSGSSDGQRAA